MSEQSQILIQMQEIIMSILKTGSATADQGKQIDELEAKLFAQKAFKESSISEHDYQGEEITALFVSEDKDKALDKMRTYEISPEDFFGFVDYHYDEDDDDFITIFTDDYRNEIAKLY